MDDVPIQVKQEIPHKLMHACVIQSTCASTHALSLSLSLSLPPPPTSQKYHTRAHTQTRETERDEPEPEPPIRKVNKPRLTGIGVLTVVFLFRNVPSVRMSE